MTKLKAQTFNRAINSQWNGSPDEAYSQLRKTQGGRHLFRTALDCLDECELKDVKRLADLGKAHLRWQAELPLIAGELAS